MGKLGLFYAFFTKNAYFLPQNVIEASFSSQSELKNTQIMAQLFRKIVVELFC